MGWSCAAAASDTMFRWEMACRATTGSQNVFEDGGFRYFWETSSTEHDDGSVTGTVWKMVGETTCRKAGTFRIDGDGRVVRAPAFLKKAAHVED